MMGKRANRTLDRLAPPFERQVRLSALVDEIYSSFLAGLFLTFLAAMLLMNDNFQAALFTRMRNALIPAAEAEERVRPISILSIDPEARLTMDLPDLLAESVEFIAGYARSHAEKRIVCGVDFVLLPGQGMDSAAVKYQRLVDVMARTPENLFLVLGGVYSDVPLGGYKYLNAKAFSAIVDAVKKRKSSLDTDRDDFTEKHFFLAHVHIAKARIESGFEGDSPWQAAIGYRPVLRMNDKCFFSMPFLMAALGKEGGAKILCDPSEGAIRPDTSENTLSEKALALFASSFGLRTDELHRDLRCDFFIPSGMETIAGKVLQISELLENKNVVSDSDATDAVLEDTRNEHAESGSGDSGINPVAQGKGASTEYFMIAQTAMPAYLGGGTEEDLVVSLASVRDRFTNAQKPIDGYNTHVFALSALLQAKHIRVLAPLWQALIVVALLSWSIWSTSRSKRMSLAVLLVGLGTALAIGASFLMFLKGILVPLKAALLFAALSAFLALFLRYLNTNVHARTGESLAMRVFPPSVLDAVRRRLGFQGADWECARTGASICLLFVPRGDVARAEFLQDGISAIIEHHSGGRQLYSHGAVLVFWDLALFPEPEIIKLALACAEDTTVLADRDGLRLLVWLDRVELSMKPVGTDEFRELRMDSCFVDEALLFLLSLPRSENNRHFFGSSLADSLSIFPPRHSPDWEEYFPEQHR